MVNLSKVVELCPLILKQDDGGITDLFVQLQRLSYPWSNFWDMHIKIRLASTLENHGPTKNVFCNSLFLAFGIRESSKNRVWIGLGGRTIIYERNRASLIRNEFLISFFLELTLQKITSQEIMQRISFTLNIFDIIIESGYNVSPSSKDFLRS